MNQTKVHQRIQKNDEMCPSFNRYTWLHFV